MTIRTFASQTPKAEYRSMQIYQILIARAELRRTITYNELGHLLYKHKSAGVFARLLGRIMYWCKENDIPTLTSIVVNSETGISGDGIWVSPQDVPTEQAKVFNFPWYDIVPPTLEELQAMNELIKEEDNDAA